MLFNSLEFAVFLPIVFVLYWWLRRYSLAWQNLLIVVSSYIFYGYWDWRFLALIFSSSLVDFMVGRALAKEQRIAKRRALVWVSILVNVGALATFKYFDFFVDNFVQAFSFFGYSLQANSLNIILPVGISFYTFQTLSYSLDVYRGKLTPTRDLTAFLAFVSFFPQLVAGPIERAENLLPQFFKKRQFSYVNAVLGIRQILWGLFKKIVIADNCAEFANLIFNNPESYAGSVLALGALFFAFQIYGDFSGYTDIAIGISRLFGFTLRQNFAYPYFSRNIAEFWRRWHISLSTWFRDYLYVPLGGSRGSRGRTIRNVFIIFLVSGFWHGANWTFIIWGALHAMLFLPVLLIGKNRTYLENVADNRQWPSFKEFALMVWTFVQVVLAWIFFRAESVTDALVFFQQMLSPSLFALPIFTGMTKALLVLLVIGGFLVVEWVGRKDSFALARMELRLGAWGRWSVYYTLALLILFLGNFKSNPFIYFQF